MKSQEARVGLVAAIFFVIALTFLGWILISSEQQTLSQYLQSVLIAFGILVAVVGAVAWIGAGDP